MTIYIDANYKCYTEPDTSRIAVETDFFDGKSQRYIEGYKFIPEGMSWIREDGVVFKGEAAFPWRNSEVLIEIQKAYEEESDMIAALEVLGVSNE